MRCWAGLLTLLLATGCAGGHVSRTEVVRVKGSDTMLILNRRLAEGFMRSHPRVAVHVDGGGTGSGVQALVAGQVDVCAASRPLSPDEVEAVYAVFGTLGVRHVVAQDALSVYLNPGNPIRDLSLAELAGLFTGAVTNWSELGGPNRAVRVVVRPPNSGTFRFFKEHVLKGGGYAPDALTATTTAEVVRCVREDVGAVGYGGLAYGADVVHCRVEGVEPSGASVRDGSYPLARYLQLVTPGPPDGAVGRFIEWAMGPGGQGTVVDVGYVALWPPVDTNRR